MPYGLRKQGWLKSEKTGLTIHRRNVEGLYTLCDTLEKCERAYKQYWQFVADEMNGPRLF